MIARRGLGERLAAWLLTGPVGHLAGGLSDLGQMTIAHVRARVRERPRWRLRSQRSGQARRMSIGRLATRAVIGGFYLGHGAQKLFGWFGGNGLDGTAGFFESLGLRPGKRHATLAAVSETATGAMLLTGALTPLAAMQMTATMTTAIRKVHAANGPWVTDSGWEFHAIVIAATAALAETGPGAFSVDAKRFPGFHGPALAALAVASGVAGSYIATEMLTEPEPPAEASPAG